MKKFILLLLIISSVAVQGCGKNDEEDQAIIEKTFSDVMYDDIAGDSASSYEVPECIPKVLVDKNGYVPDGEKIILFLGEDLTDSFEVLDVHTKNVVYRGAIKSTKIPGISKGMMTDFQTEGTYYIKVPVIGQSYEFSINASIYEDRQNQILNDIKAAKSENKYKGVSIDISGGYITDGNYSQDVTYSSGTVVMLLMTYELNPDKFASDEDRNGIPDMLDMVAYEVNWLLKMQDESGGISSGIVVNNSYSGNGEISSSDFTLQEISPNATASYVAALSLFSGIYKNYDAAFSDKCLYSAFEAYDYISINEASPAYKYMADAAMYKTTGIEDYGAKCQSYRASLNANKISNELIIEPDFIGDYAYLTTSALADITLCGQIMNGYLTYAKEISALADKNGYMIYEHSSYDIDKNVTILDDMKIMTYVNYIITNKEYRDVIQNHMHYLYGENPKSINYVDDSTFAGEAKLYYQAVELFIISNIENKYVVEH